MCLTLTPESKTYSPDMAVRRLYKLYLMHDFIDSFVERFNSGGIVYLNSPFQDCAYSVKRGEPITSNRPTDRTITALERTIRRVNLGLHLYDSPKDAIWAMANCGSSVCMEMECQPAFFVASGLFGSVPCSVYHQIAPLRLIASRQWNYNTHNYEEKIHVSDNF